MPDFVPGGIVSGPVGIMDFKMIGLIQRFNSCIDTYPRPLFEIRLDKKFRKLFFKNINLTVITLYVR